MTKNKLEKALLREGERQEQHFILRASSTPIANERLPLRTTHAQPNSCLTPTLHFPTSVNVKLNKQVMYEGVIQTNSLILYMTLYEVSCCW